jgi:predicted RNA binding protein YcfA (HicA-like mRNA interferase family)
MPKITDKHRDGNYLIKEAKKAGLRVENGKGDHVKIYAPEGRGYMVVPSRQMGTGLAASVVKWLIAAGVTLAIVCLIFAQ